MQVGRPLLMTERCGQKFSVQRSGLKISTSRSWDGRRKTRWRPLPAVALMSELNAAFWRYLTQSIFPFAANYSGQRTEERCAIESRRTVLLFRLEGQGSPGRPTSEIRGVGNSRDYYLRPR